MYEAIVYIKQMEYLNKSIWRLRGGELSNGNDFVDVFTLEVRERQSKLIIIILLRTKDIELIESFVDD